MPAHSAAMTSTATGLIPARRSPMLRGSPLPGPFPSMATDRIDNVQVGLAEKINLQKHPAEHLPVSSRLQVPGRLAGPDDRAEQVLHRAGHGHHLMGLQLGEVDQPVRLHVRAGHREALEQALTCNIHGVKELRELGPFLFNHPQNPGLLRDPPATPDPGRIPHQRDTACLLHQPDHPPQHLRVGGDRLFRRLGRQHVRFYEHPLAGTDKCPHPAKRFQKADEAIPDSHPVIIGNFLQRYGMHGLRLPYSPWPDKGKPSPIPDANFYSTILDNLL